ncbi:MAG: DUF4129 domain-containing protein, partial [Acidimicrobiia bacterium]
FVANQGRDSSQWSIGQFLLVVLLAGVLLWGALWIAVYFRIGQFGQMARWVPGLRPRPADEERTSVFSLRSLFGRLRAFLARLFGGRRRRRAGSVLGATAGDATPLVGAPPVRREYQEMLVAAGRTDAARLPTETVLEFEDRLSPRLEPAAAALSLRRLTGLYSDVRYGERPADADSEVTASAASAAGAVIAALEALPAPESPARGPSGLGVTPAG